MPLQEALLRFESGGENMKQIYKILSCIINLWLTCFFIAQTLQTWKLIPVLGTGIIILFCTIFYEEIMEDGTKSKS